MQIVIDISEEAYEYVKQTTISDEIFDELVDAFRKGTPLPKGHGRLVDISKIDKDKIESDNPIIYLTVNGQYTEAISLDYLNALSTIIEADTESEDNTNLCNQCSNEQCIFQSGIVRNHCDFYKAESE